MQPNNELSNIKIRDLFRRKAAIIKGGKPIPMKGQYKGKHVLLNFSELRPGHVVVFLEKEYNKNNRTIYRIKSKPFINDSKQNVVTVENTGHKISEEILRELTEERANL